MKTYPLPIYVQRFFTERLTTQMRASPHTTAAYRDTFRLLLSYASEKTGREPTRLYVADLSAELIGNFLDHIETTRHNSARSRNARLCAIHSFFKYVSLQEPQLLHHCQRILAMPSKRYEKRTVSFLTQEESEALIAAPDLTTKWGRRDRALLLLALQTGLRVSELTSLTCADITLGTGAHVRCLGKGRKQRSTPLRKDCAQTLRAWMTERAGAPADPLFPSNRGTHLSRDAVEHLVAHHAATASRHCPILHGKHITPHTLRHSAAMQLLHNGVDLTVIALWLGHESVETTHLYLHANLQLKEQAMAKTNPLHLPPDRYHPTDQLLAFLEAL